MPSLNIPHIQQTKDGWCLPACVAMVTAYWQQPLLQDDVALWLGATNVGVPASRVHRLSARGWTVVYRTGSLQDVISWLEKGIPCILFVRTGDLPYWELDTPHAIVASGVQNEIVNVIDPAKETAPFRVGTAHLLLACLILSMRTLF